MELVDSTYFFILDQSELKCNDFSNVSSFYRFLKFDSDWNEIELWLPNIPDIFSVNKAMVSLPDGGFLVFSYDGDLEKRDAQGELIWAKTIPLQYSGVRDFQTISGDTTVIATFDNIFILDGEGTVLTCLLYTSPSPRDRTRSRMPSSA